MQRKAFVLLLFICISLVQSFQINTNDIQVKTNRKDKMGNITALEWQNFQKTISWAEGNYTQNDLNDIAKFIYEKMSDGQYAWSVYVFGKDTSSLGFKGYDDTDKYFWKFNYGKYNLTYMSYGAVTCYGPRGGGGIAEFGQSISSQNQDKIKQLVTSSVLYRGDNIQGASQYLSQKLKSTIHGSWTAVVTSPSTKFGYYVCMWYENWVTLRSYEQLKWNYILTRNYLT